MKLFIVIAVASLSAVIMAGETDNPRKKLSNPRKKLINPDFLFVLSWEYQTRLAELQEEINQSIGEAQAALSNVLKLSTSQTLRQYQNHVNEVESVYTPLFEEFQVLKPGECKNDAEEILNKTTTNTGYRASNCALTYDTRVAVVIEEASEILSRFDDSFGQIHGIVVKSFVGRNSFTDPEGIEETITKIFEQVKGRWENSKPEIGDVRNNLNSAIAAQLAELVNCHNANLNYAKKFFALLEDTIQVCSEFDNTPNPFAASVIRLFKPETSAVVPSNQKRVEFAAAFDTQQPYEWKA